jgi:tripartite-type tricarboxylate transporter receptor subunit TctC
MRSFIRNMLDIAGVVCIAAPLAVLAQAYPSKPVRIIVPHSAGGPGDVLARGVAQSLGQVLGQPFVVENRVGTDSIIAVEACVRSAPDGSTLCTVDSFAITLNPVVRFKLPYDPDRDLAPVVQFGTMGSAFSVGASVPVNSLRELFELAKAKPESLAFGTYGLASANHLYVEWLKNAKDIRFLNVPYKAATQAMQALLAGEIQVVAYSLGASMPHAKSGKIKILAVAGDERSAVLPNVPSFKEAGLDISIRTWFGMFAPAATPRDIVQRLNAEVAKLLRVPQFKDKFLTAQGIEINGPAGGSTEDFARYIRQEREMYANMVKVVGLKAD